MPQASALSRWLNAEEIKRAIVFRQRSGLRSDEVWVRTVAAAPEAVPGVAAFSIPLMPGELEILRARARLADEVMPIVESYGEAQPEWAGAYVDTVSGRVVALFTDGAAEHEAELRYRLHPDALFDVVDARWTLQELRALQREIGRDADWLRDHGHQLLGVGVNIPTNLTIVDVSSADPDVARILVERYGGEGRLLVTSDGTGVRLWPTGTLRGRIVDAAGEPVADVLVELVGDIPGAGPTTDVGHATGPMGRFEFLDVTAVGYEIRVYKEGDAGRNLLGATRAVVRAGKVTEVAITID